MRSLDLKLLMLDGLRATSGLEQNRNYLGMSRIHLCPLRLYREFVDGVVGQGDEIWAHWFCMLGYGFQGMMTRLVEAGLYDPQRRPRVEREVEVVAGFDARFRGHIDLVVDQTPIEFKSVSLSEYNRIVVDGRLPRPHWWQLQLYLKHGGFERGLAVYVARDASRRVGDEIPLWVFDLYPVPGAADRLDQKAREVLKAVDSGRPPACLCGRCRNE